MAVLQLCKYYHPFPGGIEQVEKTISRALLTSGIEVYNVAFSAPPMPPLNSTFYDEYMGPSGEIVCEIKQDMRFLRAPINWYFHRLFPLYLENKGIDTFLVHVPNPYMHELSHFIKKKFLPSLKIYCVYHADVINQKFLRAPYNYYFLKSSHFYDSFLCSTSELVKNSPVLSAIRSIDYTKISIIPFAPDIDAVSYQKRPFNGKLVAIGRMVPYKGFDLIIKALQHSSYELHLIGDGPLRASLENLAQSLKVNVIFHRECSDAEKFQVLEDCSVLILSSINPAEAYGMVITEAFSRGRPVIASNVSSGIHYLVKNNERGLLFQVGSSQDLRDKIDLLQQDQSLYSILSSNSYEFYSRELSFERFRERLLLYLFGKKGLLEGQHFQQNAFSSNEAV